jgi:alkyl hydroperoxide reductase subunit AhpC
MQSFEMNISWHTHIFLQIILCSTDSKYTHFAWRTMAKKFIGYESLSGKKVPYAMIGDKNQRLSRALGVLDEKGGYSKTALLIIDKEGRVRHREVKQNGQLFSAAEIQSLVVDLRAKVWLAYGQVLGFS